MNYKYNIGDVLLIKSNAYQTPEKLFVCLSTQNVLANLRYVELDLYKQPQQRFRFSKILNFSDNELHKMFHITNISKRNTTSEI